ncbi:MAG: FTR1 family protein [Thermincola sp.]|jgi:high-affinity iron transporter|nr:FTR1 family protein [Thermincola sp.]MDT3703077.1 FTR1 family protein [Thermincola sp.]
MDFQAFIITFRETLEALLIVGIITTYLGRINQSRWNKWVWLGVVLALISSLMVALLFQVVLTGYGSMANQIYLRVGIMFASTALLTHMIFFIAKQANDMTTKIHSDVDRILSTGSILNMIIHSYLVVLREGVETVFFFAAISGGDIQKAISSWGALLGLVLASVVSYFFFRGSRKVPLGTFFKGTAVIMCLIAAGLLVQGVGILQDLKLMGSVYRTPGGEIGEVYNIVGFMPEHPIDETQYIRDTGKTPLISGQIGIFLRAFLGYTHNPSLEEFALYWSYYLIVFLFIARQKKASENRQKVIVGGG